MKKKLHILGVGGTFMAGLARLAVESGKWVTGADVNLYPPMDEQIRTSGVDFRNGYQLDDLPNDDSEGVQIVIGNVMRRGQPIIETVLDRGLDYISGPQWLAENVLRGRWVIAVSGTHGKTTTASLIAHIMEEAGLQPGFLIGGVPRDFGVSARLGNSPFFVIEADEYDCSFFDKRAKFLHYHPRTLVISRIEFDHADIYPDLDAIERQFHHLVRTVPASGEIIAEADIPSIHRVIDRGCWTPLKFFGEQSHSGLSAIPLSPDASSFRVLDEGKIVGEVCWSLSGRHNLRNALAALAATRHAGVPLQSGIEWTSSFSGVQRRQEVCGKINDIIVLDDFAHHPTAIFQTLEGLRPRIAPKARLIALVEPRSFSMRQQVHGTVLAEALSLADYSMLYLPSEIADSLESFLGCSLPAAFAYQDVESLIEAAVGLANSGDCIVIMSNGSFAGVRERLPEALKRRWGDA